MRLGRRRRRRSALTCLALAALCVGGTGCSFFAGHRAPARTSTVIAPAEMRDKLTDDRQRLAGIDSPRHVAHTYLGVDVTGEGPFQAVGHVLYTVPKRIYHTLTGDTPIKYASLQEDTKSPDHRREAILKLADYRFARTNPVYSKRWDQIATEPGADPTVRAAAIRAMNHARSKVGADSYVLSMDDPDAAVRLEAAKALANVPAEKGAAKLIEHLQRDDSKDVRIACADALRNYKTPEVARALVDVLTDREFGVAYRARESLILMTGHNFRFDEAAWLDYFAKTQKPFH